MNRALINYTFIAVGVVMTAPIILSLFAKDSAMSTQDYVSWAVFMVMLGLLYWVTTTVIAERWRSLATIFFSITVLLVWVELAVGLFGSSIAGS